MNKNLGDDFREGKLTLPVILALRAADSAEREFWQSALHSDAHHPELFNHAQQLMRKHDVFTAVRAQAVSFTARAAEALNHLPVTPLRAQLLDVLQQTLERQG